MSFYEARNAINGLINTGWTGPKLYWDNTASPPASTTEFCRVNIIPAAANQASIAASPTTRTTGNIIVQVFVKANQATKRMDEITDLLVQQLQYKALRGEDWSVKTRAVVPNPIGQREGSNYYQVNVMVQYFMDAK